LYLLKLLAGPVAFVLAMATPLGLSYEGRVALATFVCVIVWWMTQPMPWAVAAMLPFLVFPAAGVMNIADTMRLYGQPIFFWILGTVLMGTRSRSTASRTASPSGSWRCAASAARCTA
jgi:sodium-dependent dicarboxylate transporter 2/3/5